MIIKDHSHFYEYIKRYVAENPECAAHVSNYVADGISEALKKERESCRDWEHGLFVMLYKNYPDSKNVVNSIVEKNKGKGWLNWDWYFADKKQQDNK